MTYQRMPFREEGTPFPWRFVFTRWLNDRLVLDRIEFANVSRLVGEMQHFEYTGEVITVRRS